MGRGFWSPFSNEQSVARGEIRFWAIVETLVAMAVFWWVAIRFETFLLLTTSLFLSPFQFLRPSPNDLGNPIASGFTYDPYSNRLEAVAIVTMA